MKNDSREETNPKVKKSTNYPQGTKLKRNFYHHLLSEMSTNEHYIEYHKYDSECLTLGKVASKKSKPNPAQNKAAAPYQQADFNYTYRLPGDKIIKDSFLVELCSVKCYGLETPHGEFNNYQIKATFDRMMLKHLPV